MLKFDFRTYASNEINKTYPSDTRRLILSRLIKKRYDRMAISPYGDFRLIQVIQLEFLKAIHNSEDLSINSGFNGFELSTCICADLFRAFGIKF